MGTKNGCDFAKKRGEVAQTCILYNDEMLNDITCFVKYIENNYFKTGVLNQSENNKK
jgi:hypothetical protein